ncbi:MAG: hypothetical protein ACRCXT_18060 [Paraclostridium sp.]
MYSNKLFRYIRIIIVASYTKYTPNMADRIGGSDSDVFYSNDNLEIGLEILKYLKNLKLKPMKNEDIDFDKIDYSYRFQLSSPRYDSIIVFVSSEDVSKVYISTQMLGSKNSHYKVIDGEFDYVYINKLISGS